MSLTPESLVRNSSVASAPDVYAKLMEVINHPRSSSGDIAAVLSEDAGLAARLLRIVNSAFFGFPRRIDSMTQAVTLVGTGQIRDLALATSVIQAFSGVPEELISVRDFWSHSLGTGVMARLFAQQRRDNNVERFFLAGVLHGVGRLILLLRAPEEERKAFELARESGEFLFRAEKQVLGFSHAKVGEALIEAWNLPPAFREAIAYQHQPQRAITFGMEASTVHLADIVATSLEWGSIGETMVPPMEASAWDAMGLEIDVLPSLFQDAARQYDAAAQAISGAMN